MPLPWLERSKRASWLCLMGVFVASCGLTFLLSQNNASRLARASEEIRFQETVITPQAPLIDPESPSVAPPPCACWKNALESETPTYFLTGFAGASYFDTTSKTSGGGMAGLNFALPIYGSLGFISRAQVNSYSGGTQYGGSVGFAKESYVGDGLMGRLGGSIILDQFTDTGLGSPYMVQSQYAINYALDNHWRVGARYTDPIHSGKADIQSIIPGASGGLPISMVDVIEANLSYSGSMIDFVQFGVGYIDAFDSVTYRTNITQPISDRLAGSLAATYDEKIGRWSGFLGLTYDFSPRRGGSPLARRSAAGKGDVVRGGVSSAASAGLLASLLAPITPQMSTASSEASIDYSFPSPTPMNFSSDPFNPLDFSNAIWRAFEFSLPQTTSTPCVCGEGLIATPQGCYDPYNHETYPCGTEPS